jgi:copper homeostasis protein
MEVMFDELRELVRLPIQGIVLGLLNAEGDIDVERTRSLIEFARQERSKQSFDGAQCESTLWVTFHRAFDMVRDYRNALQQVASIGHIQRILSSGLDSSCLEGLETLRELNNEARKLGLIVVAGGGITDRNISRIIGGSGVSEFHASARRTLDSEMRFRNNGIFMGGTFRPAEFQRSITSAERLAKFVSLASSSSSTKTTSTTTNKQ